MQNRKAVIIDEDERSLIGLEEILVKGGLCPDFG